MGKIQCLECDEILESKHRHDFVMCKCPNQTFVDGGDDYMRIGGVDMSKIQVIPDMKKWSQTRNLAKGHCANALMQLRLMKSLTHKEQLIVDRCQEELRGVITRWEINNEMSRKDWKGGK